MPQTDPPAASGLLVQISLAVGYTDESGQFITLDKLSHAIIRNLQEEVSQARSDAELTYAALSSEVQAMHRNTDPFWPDWSQAPEWAEYRTVDADGQAIWWRNGGIILGADAWYHDPLVINRYVKDPVRVDLAGLDWRNSLRARPIP